MKVEIHTMPCVFGNSPSFVFVNLLLPDYFLSSLSLSFKACSYINVTGSYFTLCLKLAGFV